MGRLVRTLRWVAAAGVVAPASVVGMLVVRGEPATLVAPCAASALLAAGSQLWVLLAARRSAAAEQRAGDEVLQARLQVASSECLAGLLTNLSRRNAPILQRQADAIDALRPRDTTGALTEVSRLSARARRNADAALVLTGDEPLGRCGGPVSLAEVVRMALGEIDIERRAEVSVEVQPPAPAVIGVAGRAAPDVAHLLAELIENALRCSPPGGRAQITARSGPGGGWTVVVRDHGIGLSDAELASANQLLASPPDADARMSKRLGLHIASRLADQHGIGVQLAPTPGGGVTATVVLPHWLFRDVSTVAGPAAVAAESPARGADRAVALSSPEVARPG